MSVSVWREQYARQGLAVVIFIPDYSAGKQRNVCSSAQPFDIVRKIK
jgi:hypothetical protein